MKLFLINSFISKTNYLCSFGSSEAYSELCQTSKLEFSMKLADRKNSNFDLVEVLNTPRKLLRQAPLNPSKRSFLIEIKSLTFRITNVNEIKSPLNKGVYKQCVKLMKYCLVSSTRFVLPK